MIDHKIHNPSFNEVFCNHLEYHLGKTFQNIDDQDLHEFFCDGICWKSVPESQLTLKIVNDTRKIVTTAFIGVDGQDLYEMVIHLGRYSLKRYAKGSSLVTCIPPANITDWIDINANKRIINLKLL